ncbi:MAG: folate-binding protein YgfZ [Burkholderiales bacterium]|nr:folate-binding protein YgfZ [Burkholderiales bacterium]
MPAAPLPAAHPAASSAALPAGLVRLDDWGVIRARGADARKFLHGQLTQDIEHLAGGRATLAGYCSAKGRLLATFVVWPDAGDDLLLACSADLLPAVLKRLSMFVLRAQCKLSDASAELPLWGEAGGEQMVGDKAGDVWSVVAEGEASAIRLPDAVVDGARQPRRLWAGAAPQGLPALDAGSWRWLEVMSGTARIVGATVEQFVPQMVNLELVGGVNFQKGCYPGQEVVARSQYRGTLKRRACIVASEVALAPGSEIFHSADPAQPAGLVALAGSRAGSPAEGAHAALVEVKLAALEAGTLHAGSADGPLLTPRPLPYPLPAEAA